MTVVDWVVTGGDGGNSRSYVGDNTGHCWFAIAKNSEYEAKSFFVVLVRL